MNYTLHFNEYDKTVRVEFYFGIVSAVEWVTQNEAYKDKAWVIRSAATGKIIAAFDVDALSGKQLNDSVS